MAIKMKATYELYLGYGYTKEQAEAIAKIDEVFEQAIELDVIEGQDAITMGRMFGLYARHHTGKG